MVEDKVWRRTLVSQPCKESGSVSLSTFSDLRASESSFEKCVESDGL